MKRLLLLIIMMIINVFLLATVEDRIRQDFIKSARIKSNDDLLVVKYKEYKNIELYRIYSNPSIIEAYNKYKDNANESNFFTFLAIHPAYLALKDSIYKFPIEFNYMLKDNGFEFNKKSIKDQIEIYVQLNFFGDLTIHKIGKLKKINNNNEEYFVSKVKFYQKYGGHEFEMLIKISTDYQIRGHVSKIVEALKGSYDGIWPESYRFKYKGPKLNPYEIPGTVHKISRTFGSRNFWAQSVFL